LTRRGFGALAGAGLITAAADAKQAAGERPVFPGIWRARLGTPERLTPVAVRHYLPVVEALAKLPSVAACPLPFGRIAGRETPRGYRVRLPLAPGEMIYGLGLQFQSLLQRGRKKTLRVNADPTGDTGDSHAPVPFYVSSHGYGVFVDTARYLTIYCGSKTRKGEGQSSRAVDERVAADVAQLPQSFERFHMDRAGEILLEAPEARGLDLYVFGGPRLREVVQRYNLFAGGGPLVPRWGLGFWYRAFGSANQQEILALAEDLRKEEIPCDVLGLEPGWQSHSYSCSFTWSANFPKPHEMLDTLKAKNFQVNLWEHAFTHPSSPIYKDLYERSGDYEVWDGLVPDFLDDGARSVFGSYHEKTLVAAGVSGFKLDECDNSDYTRYWSFPELGQFPSGADGEQMHCFFGLRYQDTIQAIFERRNQRTLGLVRSSHALAAPYPYALYSDLYDHEQFIRAVTTASFGGLLWCPEVRDAKDTEDLIRRLQTVVFSPVAMVNAWYIRHAPWKQVNRDLNNAGQFAESWKEVEAICKRLIEVRMQLVPYLYSAFVRYHETGVPPFRATVIDYPDDPKTWALDSQYLMGESMLVAPVLAGEHERRVYLPQGEWFDFWTGTQFAGGRSIVVPVPLDRIPVFVKSGTLLPLARPTLHTADPNSFELSMRAYGTEDVECVLHEDDGSLRATISTIRSEWKAGEGQGIVKLSGAGRPSVYRVTQWVRVGQG
jgi:alpha-D-xyloside xylohydrolase